MLFTLRCVTLALHWVLFDITCQMVQGEIIYLGYIMVLGLKKNFQLITFATFCHHIAIAQYCDRRQTNQRPFVINFV